MDRLSLIHIFEDLSWVVCHQANSRIIDHCIKALQADPAKFYKNMDRHGNTSAEMCIRDRYSTEQDAGRQ